MLQLNQDKGLQIVSLKNSTVRKDGQREERPMKKQLRVIAPEFEKEEIGRFSKGIIKLKRDII